MNGCYRVVRLALVSLFVGLLASATAFGDIPGPGPHPRPPRPYPRPMPPVPAPAPAPAANSNGVPMTISVDQQATESVLTIPRKLLLRAGKVGEDEAPSAPGTTRSIIASLAMSLGIVGAFFVRRSRRGRALVAGVICVAAMTAAGTLFADIALPPTQPAQPANTLPITLQLGNKVEGKVVIHIANSGDEVTLMLSSNGAAAPMPVPAPPAPPAPEAPAPTAPLAPAQPRRRPPRQHPPRPRPRRRHSERSEKERRTPLTRKRTVRRNSQEFRGSSDLSNPNSCEFGYAAPKVRCRAKKSNV